MNIDALSQLVEIITNTIQEKINITQKTLLAEIENLINQIKKEEGK